MNHIRKPVPRKGGNNFYRDKNDYSRFAASLCGAAITDRDVDYLQAGTKLFAKWSDEHQGETCEQCLTLRGKS